MCNKELKVSDRISDSCSKIRRIFFCNLNSTGWERAGQMLCMVDTSLSVLMTLRMCLRELCCVFTVWI